MARQPIDRGTFGDKTTGDILYDAFGKVNDNETELYGHAGNTSNPHGVTREQTGAAPRLAPAPNLMPDSGRYGGKQNPMQLTTPGAFSNLGWLGLFNGSTSADGGKFVHNNTTNGGTAGTLTQTVIDLLAAMGRTDSISSRYGTEFRVAAHAMGAGTVDPKSVNGVTRYLAGTNGSRAMYGVGNLNTFAAWVRCTSHSVMFFRNPLVGLGGVVRSELNGAEQASHIILTPADGWKHVLVLAKTFAGYDGNHPYLYAETGATWEVACPYFAPGEVNLDWRNDHAAPLPTVNELLA